MDEEEKQKEQEVKEPDKMSNKAFTKYILTILGVGAIIIGLMFVAFGTPNNKIYTFNIIYIKPNVCDSTCLGYEAQLQELVVNLSDAKHHYILNSLTYAGSDINIPGLFGMNETHMLEVVPVVNSSSIYQYFCSKMSTNEICE